MIDLITKKVRKIQLHDITLEFLCNFYENAFNRERVLLLYENDKYITNIAYEEIVNLIDEKELVYFLRYICKEKSIDDGTNAKEKAEIIFENNAHIFYILLKTKKLKHDESDLFYVRYNVAKLEEVYRRNLSYLKNVLHKKHIQNMYFVRFPEEKEVKRSAQHPEWKFEFLSCRLNWTKAREKQIKKYLNKFTDMEYDEAKDKLINRTYKLCLGEDFEKTIFLVGPCIVAGWESFLGEAFNEILYKRLLSLNLKYRVISVLIQPYPESNMRAILEHNIKENDIVLFLDYDMEKEVEDVDLSYIFNNYTGKRWLYSDWPIHTTRIGNELIVDELIKHIIQPIADQSNKALNHNILLEGSKQLTYKEHILLQKYLANVKRHNASMKGTIGACVMTCNPFTMGHYHLVEYASRRVDFLYIFVVEEDGVYFPFEDRIEMVRRGVTNFKNVIVVPSGKFIISKATFKGYFVKESCQNIAIDAAKDTMIFREYIAPWLGISKRFIGEEPNDYVTNQYNMLLKKDLSEVIEVIEIPRRKAGGDVISASKVRKFLEGKDWDSIERMVPQSTLKYLRENYNRIQKYNETRTEDVLLDRVIRFIRDHKKIVICGLGSYTENLMRRLECILDAEDIIKLEYYDTKKAQLNQNYRGKKILSFEALINKCKNYYMFISTPNYKKDIFYLLISNNINPEYIVIADETF